MKCLTQSVCYHITPYNTADGRKTYVILSFVCFLKSLLQKQPHLYRHFISFIFFIIFQMDENIIIWVIAKKNIFLWHVVFTFIKILEHKKIQNRMINQSPVNCLLHYQLTTVSLAFCCFLVPNKLMLKLKYVLNKFQNM